MTQPRAGGGGRAQSSTPTIFEQLSQRQRLAPTIRSESGKSYDEARPGYAERDRMAGNELEYLARSLGLFGREATGVMQQRLDRTIEEGVAAGQVLFAEDPNANKNMQDWKAFTEVNPQYTGDNPWLKRGYEQARLKSLGLELEKRTNDNFLQSGMINETDPQKVQTWLQDQADTFRKEKGLDTYADKLFLAQNYTAMEFATKQGMLNQHSQYVRNQQEERTATQYTDLALQAVEGFLDPTRGGGNLNDPHQYDVVITNINNAIATNIKDAVAHGVRDTKAPEMALNMYLTAYSKTGNTAFLRAIEQAEIGGVKLLNHPGVAEKVEAMHQKRLDQQRADLRHSWAVQEHNDKLMEKALTGAAYQFALSGKAVTPDVLVEMGIPDRFAGTFAKQVGTVYEGMQKTTQLSPLAREELARARIRAERGELSELEAINLFRDFGAEGKATFTTHIEAQTEQGKLRATTLQHGGNRLFSMLSRSKSDFDLKVLLSDADLTLLTQEQREGREAVTLFHAEFNEAFTKQAKENGGSVTPDQAVLIENTVMNKVIEQMEKQKKWEAPQTNTPPQQQQQSPPQTAPAKAPVDPALLSMLDEQEPGAGAQLAGMFHDDAVRAITLAYPDLIHLYENRRKGGD